MNKKGILGLLGLAIAAVMFIYGSTAVASAKMLIPVRSNTGDIALTPQLRHTGFVIDYAQGRSITIRDEDKKIFTFDLSPQVEITPASLANGLGVGSYVTVSTLRNMPENRHMTVAILIHERIPDDLKTFTPSPTPSSTPVPAACNNIAPGNPAVASAQLDTAPASQAVDGDLGTMWNSGQSAPQWIEINLLVPQTVHEIRMYAAQSPAGETTYELWVAGSDKFYTKLDTTPDITTGPTAGQQLISYPFNPALTAIQWVKVVTTSSPSPVAWDEIQVCTIPPAEPLIPAPKPDLADPQKWSDKSLTTIIGYSFPPGISEAGIVPLEAAAFQDIQPNSDGPTRIGMISIAPIASSSPTSTPVVNTSTPIPTDTPGPIFAFPAAIDTSSPAEEPIKYTVEIDDIHSTAEVVSGSLVSADGTSIPVNFRRTSQIVNPERQQSKYDPFNMGTPPQSDVVIGASTVCFVVDVGKGTGIEDYQRYCTTSDPTSTPTPTPTTTAGGLTARESLPLLALQTQTATPAPPAPGSIRAQYPAQYAAMQTMIADTASHLSFVATGVADIEIDKNEIISTIEGATDIEKCATADANTRAKDCASDIIVAPVTMDYFNKYYAPLKNRNTSASNTNDTTSIIVGVVRVLGPFEFTAGLPPTPTGTPPTPTDTPQVTTQTPPVPPSITIEPGDYVLRYVFDKDDGSFYAAQISGVTVNGVNVDYTQIPAIPMKFVDPNDSPTDQQPIAVISGFCMYRWCCGEGYWYGR